MGKYLYPDLTDELAAVVSTHGYYEIQQRDTFNGYSSTLQAGVYRTDADGNKVRCPPVVPVRGGLVEELGLTYDPSVDDLTDPELETEDDGYALIRARLLALIEGRPVADSGA